MMNSKQISNMDNFLAEIGLCRKAIVNDGSCLFRAVSEKVYLTQTFHGMVKRRLFDHIHRHLDDYQSFVDEDLVQRMDAMEKGEVHPGLVEMIILSRIYSLDFTVYYSPSQEPFNLTQNNFNKEICLCYVGDSQYDLIYSKAELQTTAVCQSVLYEVLYRDVFGLDTELDEAVLFLELQKELPRNNNFRDCFLSDVISLFGVEKAETLKKLCAQSSPPVPYRIAKALHPGLFRNVELDIVQEEKREARLRRLGISSRFSPGDKCQVVLDDREDHPYHAHIQNIDEDLGTVLVFVEELGVKQTVPAKSVSPLPLCAVKPGDPAFLPVANIDLLRFLKKGRRRRHHRVMPIAILSDQISNLPCDRGRTISTTSTNSNSSGTKDIIHNTRDDVHNNLDNTNPNNNLRWREHNENTFIGSTPAVSDFIPFTTPINEHQVGNFSTVYGSNPGVPYPVGDFSENNSDGVSCSLQSCPVTLTFTPQSDGGPGGRYHQLGNQHHVMSSATVAPLHAHPPPNHHNQGGYWMPVVALPPYPHQAQTSDPNNIQQWTVPNTGQDGFGKDLPLSGVEYYRMSSSGQPTANCYPPPGVMFTPSNPGDLGAPHRGAATAGTAVMVDASGNHHYTSVLYSPQEITAVDAQGMPTTLCIGEEHSSSCSNSFVAPLSFSGDHPPPFSSSSSLSHASKLIPNGSVGITKQHFVSGTSSNWTNKDKTYTTHSSSSTSTVSACSSSVNSASNIVISNSNNNKHIPANNKKVNVVDESNSLVTAKDEKASTATDNDDSVSEDGCMDVGSDRDSGCSSDYTNGSTATADDGSGNSAPFIGPTYPVNTSSEMPIETDQESQLHDGESIEANADDSVIKPRGKRRYYMYGSHKLVKPIKEIPLRFQILLAETSAAKARCEGQPIYMQHQQTAPPPMYDVVYYQLPDATGAQNLQQSPTQGQLNANANCFVPGQSGIMPDGSQTMATSPYECYTLCYPNSTVPATNMHAFPTNTISPTPLFVPPPAPAGTVPASAPITSQNGQTIIVYSSQASPVTVSPSGHIATRPVNMPPPPFPPPTSLPPPPTEPMSTNSTPCLSPSVNPVVVSIPTNPHQPKSLTSSPTYSTKPQVVLSVPPPNTTITTNPKFNAPSLVPPPPPNTCMLPPSNHQTFLPQPIPTIPHSQPQQPAAAPPGVPAGPYPGAPQTSQYMYVYPSPPTGQSPGSPQVMFMAYPTNAGGGFQQPVIMPSCPVPVQ